MSINIDDLSVELSQEIALENLEKKLPPKLMYRYRRWMRRMHPQTGPYHFGVVNQAMTQKMEDIEAGSDLAKNEAMASFYDNGIVKMDFGPDVDPKVKEAALKWAKRRGLNPVEASLNKGADSFQSAVFSVDAEPAEVGTCTKRLRWRT